MKNSADKRLKIWYEIKDLLAGAAFPLMLQIILSVSFIAMTPAITADDALSIVLLVIGELLLAVAYFIFGRYSGVTSVRKLVQNTKKRDMGTTEKQALFGTGEYSAYKGFVMGLISCLPYALIQLIELCAHNSFCDFLLQYVFGWAIFPFSYIEISSWLNFIWIIVPTVIHGIAYIIGAYREWDKQQKIVRMQNVKDKKEDK